jgi:hypothetical protein
LEHLSEKQVRKVLNESYRVLKPHGAARFVTPNLRKESKYAQDDLNFCNWPDRRKSIGKIQQPYVPRPAPPHVRFQLSLGIACGRRFLVVRSDTLESAIFSAEELRTIQWEKAEDHRSLFVERSRRCHEGFGYQCGI